MKILQFKEKVSENYIIKIKIYFLMENLIVMNLIQEI